VAGVVDEYLLANLETCATIVEEGTDGRATAAKSRDKDHRVGCESINADAPWCNNCEAITTINQRSKRNTPKRTETRSLTRIFNHNQGIKNNDKKQVKSVHKYRIGIGNVAPDRSGSRHYFGCRQKQLQQSNIDSIKKHSTGQLD
jgi:hypothetical protein